MFAVIEQKIRNNLLEQTRREGFCDVSERPFTYKGTIYSLDMFWLENDTYPRLIVSGPRGGTLVTAHIDYLLDTQHCHGNPANCHSLMLRDYSFPFDFFGDIEDVTQHSWKTESIHNPHIKESFFSAARELATYMIDAREQYMEYGYYPFVPPFKTAPSNKQYKELRHVR